MKPVAQPVRRIPCGVREKVKFPVSNDNTDLTKDEVNSMKHWATSNRMTLNLLKTWEMLIYNKTTKPDPPPVPIIERKSWLKLLGVTFQENPCCWDLLFDNLIAKASSRLYILRVCKFYGYSRDQLNKLFDLLVISIFAYGVEVWGSACQIHPLQDVLPPKRSRILRKRGREY